MISKSAASFLILLSLLTVSLPFAAAQRAATCRETGRHCRERFPFSLPGKTGPGGVPSRGLSMSVSRLAAPGSIPHTQTVFVHSFTGAEPRPGDY